MGWFTRLCNLVRRRDVNAEIDQEFAFHIEARTQANRAAGMTDHEARREALRRFGSRSGLRERVRDADVLVQIERLWHDVRHGVRVWARSPGLATIAVLSIALGTGANVAVFSMADALLLRPLPVAEPGALVAVGSRVLRGTTYQSAASFPDYQDIRARTRTFDGLLAFDHEMVALTLRPGEPPRVRFATFVSENFFSVLGVALPVGRGFRPDEADIADPRPVVVLSDSLWRSEFGAAPSVVGRTLRVAGVECEIIGIAPPTFTGLHTFIRDSLYLPLGMLTRMDAVARSDALDARDVRILRLKGRLHPGATIAQARAEMATIQRDLERQYPETNTNLTLLVQTEFDYRFEQRPLDASMIVVLTILAVAVMAVACANVAGLLASRAPIRAREMAMRLAMGAGRPRLVRQLVTESLVVASAGGIAGLAVANVGIRLLGQISFPSETLVPPAFELNDRALLFSLIVAMVSAFLVGLAPAWEMTRVDLAAAIKSTDRGNSSRQRLTGRAALVTLQVTLSLVVLTIAAFSVQVFNSELAKGPGFRTTQIAKVTVNPAQARYSRSDTVRFVTRLLDEARALPGVESAAITSAMPLFSFQFVPLLPEGQRHDRDDTVVPVWAASVDDRYFATMEIPIVAGRSFVRTDDGDAPAVAIVNETLARQYWPDSDPIGKRLRILQPHEPLVEVVGVVKTTTLQFPGERPQQAVFFPYQQRPGGAMVLLARTAGESSAQVMPLRDLVRRLDPGVPVYDGQTMEDFYIARVTAIGDVLIRLTGGMGLMGLALTMIGLYGLVSYSVARRAREFGIRIAIGATWARVVGMVLREGMLPVWCGLAAGVVLSVVTGRLMTHVVPVHYEVTPATLGVVVPLMLVVNAIAALVPAARAASVEPTIALRSE
jgi:predicted permease